MKRLWKVIYCLWENVSIGIGTRFVENLIDNIQKYQEAMEAEQIVLGTGDKSLERFISISQEISREFSTPIYLAMDRLWSRALLS